MPGIPWYRAAASLGVAPRTLLMWASRGLITVAKVGEVKWRTVHGWGPFCGPYARQEPCGIEWYVAPNELERFRRVMEDARA